MYSRVERNLENNWPTAILYSPQQPIGDGWEQLLGHSCGGFSCDYLDGWAYLLSLCTRAEPIVSAIAEEQFCKECENTSMDYRGGLDFFREQQEAYRRFLGCHGLTVSDEGLASLKQAAYPLDATQSNLQILVRGNRVPAFPLDGLMIFVLGDNCD